jgi:hypothetical protein
MDLDNKGDTKVLFDGQDLELILPYTWAATKPRPGRYTIYAKANFYGALGIKGSATMHTLLLRSFKASEFRCDHINGNGLDNRRCNLRLVTGSQNAMNAATGGRKGASRFKGVTKKRDKWIARITKNYCLRHLGCFSTEEEAAEAYDKAARELFGVHARLNFP